MGVNTKQMMFELWSNKKYDSFMVDSRPRSVVLLNLFHISYPFIEQDYQIYPDTLKGAHLLKILT